MAAVSHIGGIEIVSHFNPTWSEFHSFTPPGKAVYIGTPPQAEFEVFVYGRICAKCTGYFVPSLCAPAILC